MAAVEHELKAHPAANHAEFQAALFVYGTVQPRGNWHRAVLGMATYVDGIATQAFNAVMAALGLDVDHRAARQTAAIDCFSRCHKAFPIYPMH